MSEPVNNFESRVNKGSESRADLLLEFADALADAGWTEIRLMPLREKKRGPVIRDLCRLDSDEAQKLLATPEEAADRIRENGVRGYYLYAGMPDHGTEDLGVLDRDEPEKWPDTPDTLRVESGGDDDSDHHFFRNDGTVENASGKDDLKDVGSVMAERQGVVVPGSLHHETENVYRMADNPGIATLSADDLPPELRPRASSSGGDLGELEPLKEIDGDAVALVEAAIREFYQRSETTQRAREHLTDLMRGRIRTAEATVQYVTEEGDGQRHTSEFNLAGLLYGILCLSEGEPGPLMAEYVDDDRAEALIVEYIAHCCREQPETDDGQDRKFDLSDDYRRETVRRAIQTFDPEAFRKWSRKRDGGCWYNDRYSDVTVDVVYSSVVTLAEEDEYPTKEKVVQLCQLRDPDRAERTHGEALSRLVNDHGQLRRARIGNRHIYYPKRLPDPEEADEVVP